LYLGYLLESEAWDRQAPVVIWEISARSSFSRVRIAMQWTDWQRVPGSEATQSLPRRDRLDRVQVLLFSSDCTDAEL
jgi:hypothetical protein